MTIEERRRTCSYCAVTFRTMEALRKHWKSPLCGRNRRSSMERLQAAKALAIKEALEGLLGNTSVQKWLEKNYPNLLLQGQAALEMEDGNDPADYR